MDPARASHPIGILPLGEVPAIAPKVIAAHISGYLNLRAVLLPPMNLPVQALDKSRLQYNAAHLIQQLESRPINSVEKIIAVFSVDLFLPVFTHVFGEARQGGRVALVSLFRLKKDVAAERQPSSITLERAAKVALHELCHLFNLTHCENQDCLMHFSGDLEALDHLPLSFCRYCRSFLRDAVSRHFRRG